MDVFTLITMACAWVVVVLALIGAAALLGMIVWILWMEVRDLRRRWG